MGVNRLASANVANMIDAKFLWIDHLALIDGTNQLPLLAASCVAIYFCVGCGIEKSNRLVSEFSICLNSIQIRDLPNLRQLLIELRLRSLWSQVALFSWLCTITRKACLRYVVENSWNPKIFTINSIVSQSNQSVDFSGSKFIPKLKFWHQSGNVADFPNRVSAKTDQITNIPTTFFDIIYARN